MRSRPRGAERWGARAASVRQHRVGQDGKLRLITEERPVATTGSKHSRRQPQDDVLDGERTPRQRGGDIEPDVAADRSLTACGLDGGAVGLIR